MLKLHLLSRAREYTALHGITDKYKDYLSVIKNQGSEGRCWAYSLTSAIEMKYALKSGNRLMLDPMTLVNNSAKWWTKHCNADDCKICLTYDEEGGYNTPCAVGYLNSSKQEMMQIDGKNSELIIKDYGIASITSVKELYDALDEHKLLYTTIYAPDELPTMTAVNEYINEDTDIDHAVVMTSVGKLEGSDAVYVELLNSWGYDVSYDGLVYVKVADDENSKLHNNLNMFSMNIWIDVDESDRLSYTIIQTLLLVFICLAVVELTTIIALCVYINKQCSCRRGSYKPAADEDTVKV